MITKTKRIRVYITCKAIVSKSVAMVVEAYLAAFGVYDLEQDPVVVAFIRDKRIGSCMECNWYMYKSDELVPWSPGVYRCPRCEHKHTVNEIIPMPQGKVVPIRPAIAGGVGDE